LNRNTHFVTREISGNIILRIKIRNTWKVLKYGAGGGWKRSVGLIM
jgi:hypothetical protein